MIDDTAAAIYKRLDQHSERLNTINKTVNDIASISKVITDYTYKVDKNYKYLFGNGEVGLDERVRNLEVNVKKLDEKIVQMINAFKWLGGIVGGYVVIEIVKFLLNNL